MSPRRDALRLADIGDAIAAIERYLKRGSLDDELIFDGCRVRLIEIGEAVKDLDPRLLDLEPSVPWREIARMRDQLTHRYFDTQRDIVQDVIDHDLHALEAAVRTLMAKITETTNSQTSLEIDEEAD